MSQVRFSAGPQTLFVLGNGPSLRGVDLKTLPGPTLGMNAAYRFWQELDWRPTYYACLDLVVGVSHQEAIAELIREGRVEKFILRADLIQRLGDVAKTERVVSLEALMSRGELPESETITTGSHSTMWAGDLGFKEVVLLGVDGNYTEIVEGAKKTPDGKLQIIRKESNPNYFFDGYQQPGDRYNIPNPRSGLHLGAWEGAAVWLSSQGIRVFQSNPNSEVPFFATIVLADALASESDVVRPRVEAAVASTRQPSTLRRRLVTQRLPLSVVTATTMLMVIIILMLIEWPLGLILFGSIVMISSVALGALWFRAAVVERLAEQERTIIGLQARALDLERRMGGAKN